MIGARALDGIVVVELGQLLAGPFAGMLMAYHGADVIKVEPLRGDPIRSWRGMDEGTSLWWRSLSRNKRCTAIDLRTERGQALVRRLPPIRPNLSLGDTLTGMHAFMGILLSLYHRDRIASPHVDSSHGYSAHVSGNEAAAERPERTGQTVDCAIYESVFNVLESVVPEYDRLGEVRQPSGTTITGVVPSGSYLARDGKYVVIGANTEPVFRRLCECIGQAQLASDADYRDNAARVQHQATLDGHISRWVAQHDAAEVAARLQAAAVPCSPIYDAADMFADPHYRARGLFETVTVNGAPLKLPAVAPKLSDTPGATRWAGPDLGAHTDEVLAEMGLDAAARAALRAAEIIA